MSARTTHRFTDVSDESAKAGDRFVTLLGRVDMRWKRTNPRHGVSFVSVEDVTHAPHMHEFFRVLENAGWTFDSLGVRYTTMTSPDSLTRLSVLTRTASKGERTHWVLTPTPAPYAHVIAGFRSEGFSARWDDDPEGGGCLLRVERGGRMVRIGTHDTDTGALPETPTRCARGAWSATAPRRRTPARPGSTCARAPSSAGPASPTTSPAG